MGVNRDVAEEVTQESFYQAIKSINKFDGSCKITTWLCAIAKNQLAVYRRKNPELASMDDAEGQAHSELQTQTQSVPSSEDVALQSSDRKRLYAKLHACPEPYRELLYLRLFSELSFREIGEILGKTENWARVTFYRAKEMLKKEILKDD